jgi:hypothetical protein
MKRKMTGVALAAAMAMPIGLLASPAPAAPPTGLTCTAAKGTATLKPPLARGATTPNKPVISISRATLGGCRSYNHGALYAHLKFSIARNCKAVLDGKSGGVSGTVHMTWSFGKPTSDIAHATLKGIPGKPATSQVLSGTITKGLFKGSKLTAKVGYTIPNDGSRITKGLSKVTFKLLPGTQLVIKK